MATVEERLAALELATSQTYGALDAKGFGVKGDGVTDDAPKIQELLNKAIPGIASVEIYFGPGTYRLGSELKIYSNTRIVASPTAVFLRDHSRYIMMNGNRSSEANPSNAGGYTGRGNLEIIGGVWDGNGTKQTGKSSIFHFGHADKIRVFWAMFKDVSESHHIEFNACRSIVVRDSFFLGMANIVKGSNDYNEAIQLDLSKPGVTTIGPADNTACRQVEIDNCYFGPSGTPGTVSVGRAIGSHTSTVGRPHFDITIRDCMIEGALTWAIRAYNWRHAVIKDNTIYNSAAGINWRAPIDDGNDSTDASGVDKHSETTYIAEISGNTIQGSIAGGRAIEVYGQTGYGRVRDVVVSDNIIRASGSTNELILFHYAEACECNNNRLNGSGLSSVLVRDSIDVSVEGNKISDSGKHGIEVVGGSVGTIVNANGIREVQGSGIIATDAGTEDIVITANRISGVNGGGIAGTSANHVRMTSGVKNATISANVFRNASGFTTTHGVYVTNTCLDVAATGNAMTGLKLYNGSTLSAGNVKDAAGNVTAS